MRGLLAVADTIERMLCAIADWSGWLMVVLMIVICFDIISRKMGYQIPGMGSTRLQELEWHLHTVLFSMWLGQCYILNAHPRVDTLTASRPLRTRAWVEIVGCFAFALPYAGIVAWYGLGFIAASYLTNESSEAVVGLSHRWIIKSLFVFGLWLLVAAIIAVILRLIVFLSGAAAGRRSDLNIERFVDPT
ncbi:TRAP transporter small permease subunit [Reyranella sp.]|uniref:TRAP transporter small permease subunit n=1 Tax=Reyranella sp. TaxID=1929291 RepID=UPI002731ED3B|nr:TRAP transporter small permease subunit [Reyranella sp.]MDP2377605.1 TRAP transporter small permease subunit [Reyranella sp.]